MEDTNFVKEQDMVSTDEIVKALVAKKVLIQQISNAIKIVDVKLDGVYKLVKFERTKEAEDMAKQNLTIIYFCVVNDEVVKIGGSSANGGLEGLLCPYENGFTGNPAIRTTLVPFMFWAELRRGSKCEIYAMSIPNRKEIVKDFDSEIEQEEKPSHKASEKKCTQKYKSIVGSPPPWNLQEAGHVSPKSFTKGPFYYYENNKEKFLPGSFEEKEFVRLLEEAEKIYNANPLMFWDKKKQKKSKKK